MKKFNVYRHPTEGVEAVKIGFSWPAFFFGIIWMLVKRLWSLASLWSLLYLGLSAYEGFLTPSAFSLLLISFYYFALWLIPGFYGNSWREKNLSNRGYELISSNQDSEVPIKVSEEEGNEKFDSLYRDLMSMLLKMAKADGIVSEAEVAEVNRLIDKIVSTSEEKRRAFLLFIDPGDPISKFEDHARSFLFIHSSNAPIMKCVVETLFAMSISDGSMNKEKELLLNAAELILGVHSDGYEKYKINSRESSVCEEQKGSAYYARVLGLSGKVTREDIKKRYKDLVRQYHPDKVSHLGPKLKEVANEEIKKINEAYEYLKKVYDV